MAKDLYERFIAKIEKASNGCWNWNGTKGSSGGFGKRYGIFHKEGKQIQAHRASWLMFKGEIPLDKHVCHACDNPPCVNPDHLFLATQKENMQDAALKKRIYLNKGESQHSSKLKNEDIKDIFYLRQYGLSTPELGIIFSVTHRSIQKVLRGISWKEVNLNGN